METNSRIFLLAKEVAQRSTHHRYRVGCVIFKKKHIISSGCNDLRTHPRSTHPYKRVHAELAAILASCSNEHLKGATIFVYMEKVNGRIGNSKPCSCCEKILRQHGIKQAYYTTTSGAIERCYYD